MALGRQVTDEKMVGEETAMGNQERAGDRSTDRPRGFERASDDGSAAEKGRRRRSSKSATDRRKQRFKDRGVRAILEVERGGFCPVDEFGGNVLDVEIRYQLGQCMGEVELRECEEAHASTAQFSSPICEHCPGIVFSRYGCIPRFLEVGDGYFTVETRLEDVETLSTLVDEIRQRCERVTVRSLISSGSDDGTESCCIDLSPLTPKQREAVSKAKKYGHYDPGSDSSLKDLATEMEISASALSQRLQRAEANIIEQLDCECDCWTDA